MTRGGVRREERVKERGDGLRGGHGSVCRVVDLSLAGRADQSVGSGAER